MTVTVRFENPIGTVVGREFEPGQPVRVTGKATSATPVTAPGTPVILDINPVDPPGAFSPIHEASGLNPWNHYWFDIPALPNVDCTAEVTVTVKWMIGTSQTTVPIGIGTIAPPYTPPEEEGGLLDDALSMVKWASIGFIGVGTIYLATVLAKRAR